VSISISLHSVLCNDVWKIVVKNLRYCVGAFVNAGEGDGKLNN
jgi:hypothetical protein